MQRRGRSYEPVLLSGSETQGVAALQREFEVEVHYVLTTGGSAVYRGRFYAADASAAEAQGRNFVTKYIRPANITDAATLPL